jgi:hypothetical protein
MVDTRGTTAPRPVKTLHSSAATTTCIVHREAKGGTSRAHLIKEVITTTPISIQPSLKDLVLGQAKINESLNKKILTNDKTLKIYLLLLKIN